MNAFPDFHCRIDACKDNNTGISHVNPPVFRCLAGTVEETDDNVLPSNDLQLNLDGNQISLSMFPYTEMKESYSA